ncbi:MAG: hypothetical protein ACPGVB_01330 [Chitinophagales bacterium]
MKITYTLLAILFSSQVSVAQNLITKYYKFGFNHSKTIEIYDNDTFFQKSGAVSCVIGVDGKMKSSLTEVYGDYKIQGDTILFFPTKKWVKEYTDKGKRKLKPPFQTLIYLIMEYKDEKAYTIQNTVGEKFCSKRNRVNMPFVFLPNIPPFIKTHPIPSNKLLKFLK